MRVFYILLNICLPFYNFVISIYIGTNGFISTSCSAIMLSSPTNSVCGFIFRCCILDTSSWCWNSLHLFLLLNFMWFCFFLTPSSKVLWFFWLYLLLLNCSIFEVQWFFKLHFHLLGYSTRPCFCLFILA